LYGDFRALEGTDQIPKFSKMGCSILQLPEEDFWKRFLIVATNVEFLSGKASPLLYRWSIKMVVSSTIF